MFFVTAEALHRKHTLAPIAEAISLLFLDFDPALDLDSAPKRPCLNLTSPTELTTHSKACLHSHFGPTADDSGLFLDFPGDYTFALFTGLLLTSP